MHLRLSVFVLLFVIAGCSRTDCINEIREKLVSPDGTKKVVVFTRNCGATTGPNTQVSVLEKTERLPDEAGTAFIIDKGGAEVSWKKDGGILVILDGTPRVFKKELSVRGIAIEYREENAEPTPEGGKRRHPEYASPRPIELTGRRRGFGSDSSAKRNAPHVRPATGQQSIPPTPSPQDEFPKRQP